MGKSCCVPRCGNRADEKAKKKGVSFFRFPANERKRMAWVKAIGRKNWTPKHFNAVCSEHFEGGWHSNEEGDVNYVPTMFTLKSMLAVKDMNENSPATSTDNNTGKKMRWTKRTVDDVHRKFSLFAHSYSSTVPEKVIGDELICSSSFQPVVREPTAGYKDILGSDFKRRKLVPTMKNSPAPFINDSLTITNVASPNTKVASPTIKVIFRPVTSVTASVNNVTSVSDVSVSESNVSTSTTNVTLSSNSLDTSVASQSSDKDFYACDYIKVPGSEVFVPIYKRSRKANTEMKRLHIQASSTSSLKSTTTTVKSASNHPPDKSHPISQPAPSVAASVNKDLATNPNNQCAYIVNNGISSHSPVMTTDSTDISLNFPTDISTVAKPVSKDVTPVTSVKRPVMTAVKTPVTMNHVEMSVTSAKTPVMTLVRTPVTMNHVEMSVTSVKTPVMTLVRTPVTMNHEEMSVTSVKTPVMTLVRTPVTNHVVTANNNWKPDPTMVAPVTHVKTSINHDEVPATNINASVTNPLSFVTIFKAPVTTLAAPITDDIIPYTIVQTPVTNVIPSASSSLVSNNLSQAPGFIMECDEGVPFDRTPPIEMKMECIKDDIVNDVTPPNGNKTLDYVVPPVEIKMECVEEDATYDVAPPHGNKTPYDMAPPLDIKMECYEEDITNDMVPPMGIITEGIENEPFSSLYEEACNPKMLTIGTQCDPDQFYLETVKLRIENDKLKKELQKIKCGHKSVHQQIIHNKDKTRYYTGLSSYEMFRWLFDHLNTKSQGKTYQPCRISVNKFSGTGKNQTVEIRIEPIDQFLAVLMRNRLGLMEEDISQRIEVPVKIFSKLYNNWILLLHEELKQMNPFSSREEVLCSTPPLFQEQYPSTILILHCMEILVQRDLDFPNCLSSPSFSHCNTLKFLLGITPGGIISFVSEPWSDSISERQITIKSGILELLKPGDDVMAHQDFHIGDILEERNCTLSTLPYRELNDGEDTSLQGIHEALKRVDSILRRVREFNILNGTLPSSLVPFASKLLQICCWLANFEVAI